MVPICDQGETMGLTGEGAELSWEGQTRQLTPWAGGFYVL
jgi:hypothetical protein